MLGIHYTSCNFTWSGLEISGKQISCPSLGLERGSAPNSKIDDTYFFVAVRTPRTTHGKAKRVKSHRQCFATESQCLAVQNLPAVGRVSTVHACGVHKRSHTSLLCHPTDGHIILCFSGHRSTVQHPVATQTEQMTAPPLLQCNTVFQADTLLNSLSVPELPLHTTDSARGWLAHLAQLMGSVSAHWCAPVDCHWGMRCHRSTSTNSESAHQLHASMWI